MSRANLKSGRVDQKLRTRAAIMDAAARLMAEGRVLTLEEVATAARVSRATAYRYFPSPDALMLETQLHVLVKSPTELFPTADGDPGERARRVLDHLQDLTRDNEPAFRQLMRSAMDRWLDTRGQTPAPLRGGRRLAMLREALLPASERMDRDAFERLIEVLAMMVSMETYIAGRDICQIPPERIRESLGWAVEVLVAASLGNGRQSSGNQEPGDRSG